MKFRVGRWALLLVPVYGLGQQPAVFPGGVVNGASFSAGQPDKRIAPGSLISIFGTNLAASVALADSIPISTSLGDVRSVTFDGIAAPILAVSPGQINVQLPWGEPAPPTGTIAVAVIVTRSTAGASAPIRTPVGMFSPGIFTAPSTGLGQALALIFPDNAIPAPANSIPGLKTRPAKPGDILQIYATGLGPVDNTPANGHVAIGAPSTTVKPVVLVGGLTAEVLFSGLAPGFVGLYQINVVTPNVAPGNAVSLQIQIGGSTSTNQATIAVAAP